MTGSEALAALLREHLAPLGRIAVKAMFGGAGAYCDGHFFAILADDVLYLKADDATRAMFDAEALPPFTYDAKGKPHVMAGYRRAPERLYDEPDELREWARAAIGVAVRAAARRERPAAARSRRAKRQKSPVR